MFTLFIWLFLSVPFTYGFDYKGATYCVDGYALCSTALCKAPSNNSQTATCQCEGPYKGLNVGGDTCKARIQSLTSTFSLRNQMHNTVPSQPQLYRVHCTGKYAKQWVSCYDQPCSTDSNGNVSCTCKVQGVSDNLFLGEDCPKTAAKLTEACAVLRSSADPSAYANEAILQQFYGNPPSYIDCQIPSS